MLEDITTTEMVEMTTLHPHAIPLPWAFTNFFALTDHMGKNLTVTSCILEGQNVKRWSQNSGITGDPFNYILAKQITNAEKIPLIVILHDGPHQQITQEFNVNLNTFLDLGIATLLVNYRGSTGMGDSSLESIISNAVMVSTLGQVIGDIFRKIRF